jgi:hypothetical protein
LPAAAIAEKMAIVMRQVAVAKLLTRAALDADTLLRE